MTTITENSNIKHNQSMNFFSKRKSPKIPSSTALVYKLFVCCLTELDPSTMNDKGAWSALIIRQPQNVMEIEKSQRLTYMLSGKEYEANHIHIRLTALKESLEWISSSEAETKPVEVFYVSNDCFIVNLLHDWLDKWKEDDFYICKETLTERPNAELLRAIAHLSKNIIFKASWRPEDYFEMTGLFTQVKNNMSENLS